MLLEINNVSKLFLITFGKGIKMLRFVVSSKEEKKIDKHSQIL